MRIALDGEYFLGIDIGTTGSKGVLVDPESGVVGKEYLEYEVTTIKPDWIEQDLDGDYWKDFKLIIGSLIADSSVNASEISAVGLSSLIPDVLPVGEDCEPI